MPAALFLSPHLDDVAFSCGALFDALAARGWDAHLVTVFTRSVPGPRGFALECQTSKGIAPEDQTRIFDKFERLDPSEPGGSGLGLYISRRLARAMGGDIIVDSAPGQGARCIFTLPAR